MTGQEARPLETLTAQEARRRAEAFQSSARKTALAAALGLIDHEVRRKRFAVSIGGDELEWLKLELERRGFDVDDTPGHPLDAPTLWVTW